jgi:hypothetical protein
MVLKYKHGGAMKTISILFLLTFVSCGKNQSGDNGFKTIPSALIGGTWSATDATNVQHHYSFHENSMQVTIIDSLGNVAGPNSYEANVLYDNVIGVSANGSFSALTFENVQSSTAKLCEQVGCLNYTR